MIFATVRGLTNYRINCALSPPHTEPHARAHIYTRHTPLRVYRAASRFSSFAAWSPTIPFSRAASRWQVRTAGVRGTPGRLSSRAGLGCRKLGENEIFSKFVSQTRRKKSKTKRQITVCREMVNETGRYNSSRSDGACSCLAVASSRAAWVARIMW